jgi:hypothetical protein
MTYYKGLTFNTKGDITLGAPEGNGVPAKIQLEKTGTGTTMQDLFSPIVVGPEVAPITWTITVSFTSRQEKLDESPLLEYPYEAYVEFTGNFGAIVEQLGYSSKIRFTSDNPTKPWSWITFNEKQGDIGLDNNFITNFEDFSKHGATPITIKLGDGTENTPITGYDSTASNRLFVISSGITNTSGEVGKAYSNSGVCDGATLEAYNTQQSAKFPIEAKVSYSIRPTTGESGTFDKALEPGQAIYISQKLNLSNPLYPPSGSGGAAVLQFALFNGYQADTGGGSIPPGGTLPPNDDRILN